MRRLEVSREENEGTAFGRPMRSSPIGHDELFSVIEKTRMPMILTNPRLPDDPIVFANRAFQQLSGYSADELLGRNCRFLQGPDTNPLDVESIRAALLTTRDITVDLLNYRKDGTSFVNELYISPILDAEGHVLYHLGAQVDVTGYRWDRRALEASEHRYRSVFDSALDFAIVVTDRDGIVTDWNKGAEHVTGWTADEIVGQDANRIATPEDRACGRIEFEMQVALRDGRAADERWHVKKGEKRFWASGEMMVLRNADGTHAGFVKIMRDRTEEHLAGEALKAAEERFRTILETVEAAFAIVEVKYDADDQPVDYRFVEANPAFEKQAGVNLRGKWVTEFAPNLEKFWFETYGRVAKSREPATFESYAEAFQRWFDVRAVPVGDPADRQLAIIFSDTTERRNAEERLRTSEMVARDNVERVKNALAAGAIIGTWLWDLPTDRFTVDEAFAQAFGLDPALGREGIPLAQIVATVHPDDQAGLAGAINEAIARGGHYAHQYRTRRADGKFYWLEANGHVTHGADGTPLTFPGVLLDLNERRKIEAERDRATAALRALNDTLEQRIAERTEELLRSEEQLRQSQKMEAVGQLTGGVAHDFNNLLTIIRSSVDFLRRPDLPEDRRKRYMDAVSDTVDRAARLTGQLLAFARRQALKPEVLNVGERLRAVADMLDTVTGARVQVVAERTDANCFIKVDQSQFETALVNIAVNARDAMNGEGTLTMRLRCSAPIPPIRGHAGGPGPFAVVELTDTGTGIAEEDLTRIFEPFFTTKEVGKGTGLGLSQVFGFAKQSGGDVDVHSVLGQGTTFSLYLPEVEAVLDAVADEEGIGPGPDGKGLKVLVVEDNIEVGKFATQILEDLGYRTEWVANAEHALDRLGPDGDGFDAVFSDVVMPGMGGIALAEELRRHLPRMPVVLASGYSHVLAQNDDHGFELLHKPYSADQLSHVLRRITYGSRRRR
ncbi:hybrid sensor histidine kinase/response regulator [Methylobacterium sp. E-045]|uniref:hybrid sensor histidine kinase/response regulator n=1 Tax=Methylobacterium sp. E-045 TaxID=2836575 RepID=UPI001FBA6899|nr:hybrid sensor histidine kinase/response regulator [Methylobacterium sp. E-045]MCJ2127582.1 PAS domain S-box protein [Methylobacterium sp. E-045]